jgi:hypothetical protein
MDLVPQEDEYSDAVKIMVCQLLNFRISKYLNLDIIAY